MKIKKVPQAAASSTAHEYLRYLHFHNFNKEKRY